MVAPTPKPTGKSSKIEELPRRDAKATIVPGDPMQRAMGNYDKSSPKTHEAGMPMFGTMPGLPW